MNSSSAIPLSSLRKEGVRYKIGPFVTALRSNSRQISECISKLYSLYQFVGEDTFADFDISVVDRRSFISGHQSHFRAGLETPFPPHDPNHALPLLEWGSNWCVAQTCNAFLVLHCGVVHFKGRTFLLPASPGSGKSTLSVSLDQIGGQLLSDEFGLLDPDTLDAHAYPRLVPLKNDAIGVIKTSFPDATLGPTIPDTRKGTIAHYRPTKESIEGPSSRKPDAIYFPLFDRSAEPSIMNIPKEEAFIKLTNNAFNYHLLGKVGFDALVRLVSECETCAFTYNSTESAVKLLSEAANA